MKSFFELPLVQVGFSFEHLRTVPLDIMKGLVRVDSDTIVLFVYLDCSFVLFESHIQHSASLKDENSPMNLDQGPRSYKAKG